jgi:hypothetical protein
MEMKNDEGEVKWNEDEVRMERERDFFGKYRVSGVPDFHSIFSV